MVRFSTLIVAAILLAFSPGCGKSGIPRQNLSGKVTFADQPVPHGMIAFRPDRDKGGSGPAGFAQIVNGEYSTKSSGKGAVSGPVVVAIEGFESNQPMAPALFAPYLMSADISQESKELDIAIPADAPPPRVKRKPRTSSVSIDWADSATLHRDRIRKSNEQT